MVDHSIPTSLGGTDTIENYRPAHNSCNRQRGNLPDGTVGTNSGALDPWAPTPWGYPGAAARRHRRTSGAPIPRGAGGGRSV
ncbi:HNH endonuclease signature motif containing protein [Nakamurella multipartita]|uniref:HNH endonuclease signature motif containing protein n=1 Tax=Nakamurella multipartita TaxID=53461 RepID=UPI000A035A10